MLYLYAIKQAIAGKNELLKAVVIFHHGLVHSVFAIDKKLSSLFVMRYFCDSVSCIHLYVKHYL